MERLTLKRNWKRLLFSGDPCTKETFDDGELEGGEGVENSSSNSSIFITWRHMRVLENSSN